MLETTSTKELVNEQIASHPTPPLEANEGYIKSNKLGRKLRYGVALVALVVVVGGILAFTQSALRQSQETRSDAANEEPRIWMSFMSDPASAGAEPIGLSTISVSRTSNSTVSVWLNNPSYTHITSGAMYVEFDPAVIDGVDVNLANQTNLTTTQQPVTLIENTYTDTASGKKVAVHKFSAKCAGVTCYPLRNAGSQYSKLATITIDPKQNASAASSQIRFLFNNSNSRSIILAKDYDVNLVRDTGYVTLNLAFNGNSPTAGPSPTDTVGVPAKVTGLEVTVSCLDSQNQLDWNQAANAQSYQIQHCMGSGCSNWSNLQNNYVETSYTHTGLTAGLHRYKVRAKNSVGNGPYSVIASGQIQATCAGVTATPSPTQATGTVPTKGVITSVTPACVDRSIDIVWSALTTATKYQLQFCKGANCGGADFKNIITSAQNYTALQFTHDNLTSGIFKYRLRGINSAGSGSWSDVMQGRIDSSCTQVSPSPTLIATATPLISATPSPTVVVDGPTITPPVSEVKVGDFNEDGVVSLAELSRVMDAYGQIGSVPENVNADDEVDLLDVTIVLANFLL